MRLTDLDWREVLNEWEVGDLMYLRSIIDEKLATCSRRKTIIRKVEPWKRPTRHDY
jgi:hypothetical protein